MKAILAFLSFALIAASAQQPAQDKNFVVVSNATGFVLVPRTAVAAITMNSNRIVFLKKKMTDEMAKNEEDHKLTWARQSAGKISAIAAAADDRARNRAMFEKFKPMDQEIAERRLSILELKRAHKIPDP